MNEEEETSKLPDGEHKMHGMAESHEFHNNGEVNNVHGGISINPLNCIEEDTKAIPRQTSKEDS